MTIAGRLVGATLSAACPLWYMVHAEAVSNNFAILLMSATTIGHASRLCCPADVRYIARYSGDYVGQSNVSYTVKSSVVSCCHACLGTQTTRANTGSTEVTGRPSLVDLSAKRVCK